MPACTPRCGAPTPSSFRKPRRAANSRGGWSRAAAACANSYRDGPQQPHDLGDARGVDAGSQQGVKDRPEGLVSPVPRDAPYLEDLSLSPTPPVPVADLSSRWSIRSATTLEADTGQCGLERAQFLAAAARQLGIDLGQPARWPIQARNVVSSTGLLVSAPRPEPLGEFIVELAHSPPIRASGRHRGSRECRMRERLHNMPDARVTNDRHGAPSTSRRQRAFGYTVIVSHLKPKMLDPMCALGGRNVCLIISRLLVIRWLRPPVTPQPTVTPTKHSNDEGDAVCDYCSQTACIRMCSCRRRAKPAPAWQQR